MEEHEKDLEDCQDLIESLRKEKNELTLKVQKLDERLNSLEDIVDENDELKEKIEDLLGEIEDLEHLSTVSEEERWDEAISELLVDVLPHIKEAHNINETILKKFTEDISDKRLLSEMKANLYNLNFIMKKYGISLYNARI